MGGTTEGIVIGKYDDLFIICFYHFPVCLTPSGVVVLITMVIIEIAPIELFIDSHIFFVAFCLGMKITSLVVAYTMS